MVIFDAKLKSREVKKHDLVYLAKSDSHRILMVCMGEIYVSRKEPLCYYRCAETRGCRYFVSWYGGGDYFLKTELRNRFPYPYVLEHWKHGEYKPRKYQEKENWTLGEKIFQKNIQKNPEKTFFFRFGFSIKQKDIVPEIWDPPPHQKAEIGTQ